MKLERPGLREDTGQVRGDEKDPFPILGTLCAKQRLVRISRKDYKSTILYLELRTKRPGHPEGYPLPGRLRYPHSPFILSLFLKSAQSA